MAENATSEPLVVDVAFPFTLATPKYGASRPFVGDHAAKLAYVEALGAEVASLDDELRGRPAHALRLSGGASIMNADKTCALVRRIKKALALEPGAQVAMDVEPLTVCTPSLTDWTSCGINRVNLAMVSANDEELAAFGAHHTREQLQNSLLFLEKFHMSNVSLEVLYGLPGQTPASWKFTLQTACGLEAPHIRVRPLVAEQAGRQGAQAEAAAKQTKTPANGQAAKDGQAADAAGPSLPGRELRSEMYAQACELLCEKGYEEYAPGDFALAGHTHARDAFEQAVREGADVLGLGAGAKSRLDGFLYENACDFDLYVEKSADFEAIVRNPLRESPEAHAARKAIPCEQLDEPARFQALEALGTAMRR